MGPTQSLKIVRVSFDCTLRIIEHENEWGWDHKGSNDKRINLTKNLLVCKIVGKLLLLNLNAILIV